jgi:hypothetical protein
VIIDEAQDLAPAELRFFAALAPAEPDGLFLSGDIGQRIFQHPYSWLSLGVDVRGRSHTLKVCYRTSHITSHPGGRLPPTPNGMQARGLLALPACFTRLVCSHFLDMR